MNKRFILKTLITLCTSVWFSQAVLLFAQEPYFDSEAQDQSRVVLTVLHPSTAVIDSLMELKKQKLLAPENLLVVGILHEKQMTDFEKAKTLVQEKNLTWIKFHTISGEIDPRSLFRINEMTPTFGKIFENSDGIIFFGGADIPPYVYGEKTNLLTGIRTPYRHFLEISFLFHLFGGSQDPGFEGLMESSPEFPVLCICLGAQSLNVAAGGTMIQDIPSEVYGHKYLEDIIDADRATWHRNPYAEKHPELELCPCLLHPILLSENGKFVQDFGYRTEDHPSVISAHHQALGKLGKGLKINATSMDGRIIEGIEHKTYPNVLGVQFHPDFPELWNTDFVFRWSPQDQEKASFLSLLEKNPPSLEFNTKIWTWFCAKMAAYHSLK